MHSLPRALTALLLALLSVSALATEQDDDPEPMLPVTPAKTTAAETDEATATPAPPEQPAHEAFEILDRSVTTNSTATLYWNSQQLLGATVAPVPVLVTHGQHPGPVACLTSAIHGDELNGIEINRRVAHQIKPDQLNGTLVSVPVVNVDGFWRRDRYLSDRRDLNRSFPGHPEGSTAARVAHSLFDNIIRHCDFVVDMHTGSLFRENLPQLRADLTNPAVADLSKGFGAISVLQSSSPPGSLRGAATAAGIPTVVLEVGGPLSLDVTMVELGVKSVRSLLSAQGMIDSDSFWSTPQPVFYESSWLRAEQGGILISHVELGDHVRPGQLLGEIRDPITNSLLQLKAPFSAVVIGRAQNQFISPGYALYHLGRRSSLEELERQGEEEKRSAAEAAVEQLGITPVSAAVESQHTAVSAAGESSNN